MAQVYIPAKRAIKGPWLLTADELDALDKTLDIIEQKLDEAAEKVIEVEANEAVKKSQYPSLYPDIATALTRVREHYVSSAYSSDKKYRIIELLTDDEKEVTGNSIINIMKDPKIKDLSFKKVSIQINNIKNNFKLDIYSKFDGELSCSAKCADQVVEYDVMYDIDLWLSKYKPTKLQQIWLGYWPLIAWTSSSIGLYLLFHIVSYNTHDFKPTYKKELNIILEKGITSENQAKAIELFIKYNTNYLPRNLEGKEVEVIDKSAARVTVIMFLIGIVSLFRPKTTIGIGRLKGAVNRYRWLERFVFAVIPSSIVLPPLFSFIRQLLGFK
jgi:hypothetical protein